MTPSDKDEQSGRISSALRRSKGLSVGLAFVLGVFVLLVASWAMISYHRAFAVARDILLAGFIGGFTNTVAIRMLFEKYWFLPGSGVLLKKKEAIVRSLADAIETHIVNPELIEEKIRQVVKELDLNKERTVTVFNAVLDELREPMMEYVSSNKMRRRIVLTLEQEGGLWGEVANALGIVEYEKLAESFCDRLSDWIAEFRIEEEMIAAGVAKLGPVEDFLLQPNNDFVKKHYGSDESIARLIYEGLNVRQLVIDKLSSYEAERVRDIVENNIREHLAWLEVFGVILGIVFASLVKALDAIVRILSG